MIVTEEIQIPLSWDNKQALLHACNLHYVGDINCNVYDEEKGELVAKYPEKETEEFKNAVRSIHAVNRILLDISIDETTGKIRDIRWRK